MHEDWIAEGLVCVTSKRSAWNQRFHSPRIQQWRSVNVEIGLLHLLCLRLLTSYLASGQIPTFGNYSFV